MSVEDGTEFPGLCEWQGISPWSGMVVCPRDTQHVHEFHGERLISQEKSDKLDSLPGAKARFGIPYESDEIHP